MSSMIKKSPKEIWFWYERIEDFRKSGMTAKSYCNVNEIEYKRLNNMIYRIDYKKYSDPVEYKKLMQLGRKFKTSEMGPTQFSKAHDIPVRIMGEVVTHMNYLEIIEKVKQEKAENRMKFIEVSPPPVSHAIESISKPEEAEVIEKQNDLEIIISKGVKVSISPNIDSMKIIKIIELLKDL